MFVSSAQIKDKKQGIRSKKTEAVHKTFLPLTSHILLLLKHLGQKLFKSGVFWGIEKFMRCVLFGNYSAVHKHYP